MPLLGTVTYNRNSYNMNVFSVNTSQATSVSSRVKLVLHLQTTLYLAAAKWIREKWKHHRIKMKLTFMIRPILA